MRDEDQTLERPRGQAWGNEAQRAVLHAIAEDVARRSGYRVAAIEALRSDGNLEFVAIAGSPEARERLLGEASPLSLERVVAFGTHIDGWVHVRAELVDEDTRAWMLQYGHTPDLPKTEGPDGWHPEDRLVRLLTSEDGALRALLYLDEPLSGLRPTIETLTAVNDEIRVMYEAIVSIVERELYGEHVRMVTSARTAVRSVSRGLEVGEFMRELGDAMVAAIAVDSFDVLLAGEPAPMLEPHATELEEHMRQVWLRRGHVILEPDQVWGIAETAVPTPEVMAAAMERRGLGSWLLVPIGMGEEYLGTMGLGRRPDGARWIDSEINAAAAVASDLAGVVVDARIMDRERRVNADLRELNDHRRDMVTTLAHELRNPVSVLWTHLDLLGQESPTELQQESLGAMDRAARRIEDMIEALMTLATISDPHRAVTRVPVDLSAAVREGCEFLATVASHGGVEIVTDIADGVVVLGEDVGLQRMVANLLSNAVKYGRPGGRITVVLEPGDSDDVRLVCTDTGIGIAEADLPHVFTPFFRSGDPAARNRPGTGLGLSIVERVVTSHGGSVDVSSRVGAGTTFVVRLPAAPVDVA